MAKVTVYTRNNCAACKGTEAFLTANEIPFTEINVEEQEDYSVAQYLVDKGFRGMPVVRVEWSDKITEWWTGSKPEQLRGLVEHLAEENG